MMETKQHQQTRWVCAPAVLPEPSPVVVPQEAPRDESRKDRNRNTLAIVIETENYKIEIEFD